MPGTSAPAVTSFSASIASTSGRGSSPWATQRVAIAHDVRAVRNRLHAVVGSAEPDRVRDRTGHDGREPDHDEREVDAAAANVRSMHEHTLPEHAFGVKDRFEHMFASPPGG